MDIISLLTQILGPGRPAGRGDHYYTCPFCHHRNPKLSVNTEKNMWRCWHCSSGGKSILSLFKKINATREQISILKTLVTETDIRAYRESKSASSNLFLPPEFVPLTRKSNSYEYKHAISYLKKRGIGTIDIIRYNIGYCEEGDYKGRIIIPSYDSENKLNYFVGRSYTKYGVNYKNPPITRNIVAFDNLISWNLGYITIVEGMFDAISVRHNAIPILGKTLPKRLFHKILQKKIRRVNVLLDGDAVRDSLIICQKLITQGIDVHNIILDHDKDPASLGSQKVNKLIRDSKKMSVSEIYRDIIKLKLAL
jgi:DNA primase